MKTKRNWTAILHEDSREPAKSYKRSEAVHNHLGGSSLYFGVDGKDWTAWKRQYALCVMGDNVFWKQISVISCSYINGKFYGNIEPFVLEIIKAFNLDWINSDPWIKHILAGKKDIWKRIIDKKITNHKDVLRYYSKKYFRGVISSDRLKKYYTTCAFPKSSLWRIYYYTTSPNAAIDRLCEEDFNRGLFDDMLYYAEYFNEKINPMWSEKRMNEEHQHQIEKKELERLEEMNAQNIAPDFNKDGLSLILNERDCYLEGCTMHNCVHSCYWHRVSRGNYLIARGVVGGVYVDLGIRLCNNVLEIDQVYAARNTGVHENVRNFCIEWIDNNYESLKDTINHIKNGI